MATTAYQHLRLSTDSTRSGLDELINQAHSFASKYLNGRGNETHRAKLLINEVVVNAVKHGNRFDSDKEVQLDIDVHDHRVDIRVEDEGNGFDPDAVPDPCIEENLRRDHGRGLFLIKSLADEVCFERGGRRVCIVIHRI